MSGGRPSYFDVVAREDNESTAEEEVRIACDGATKDGKWGIGISETSGIKGRKPLGFYAGGEGTKSPLLLDANGAPSQQTVELLAKIFALAVVPDLLPHPRNGLLNIEVCTDSIAHIKTLMDCARERRRLKVGADFYTLLLMFAAVLVELLHDLRGRVAGITFIQKTDPRSAQDTIHKNDWMPDILAKLGMKGCAVDEANWKLQCTTSALDFLSFSAPIWTTESLLGSVTICIRAPSPAAAPAVRPPSDAGGSWNWRQEATGVRWSNAATGECFWEDRESHRVPWSWKKYRCPHTVPTTCWWCATYPNGAIRDFFFEATGTRDPPRMVQHCER